MTNIGTDGEIFEEESVRDDANSEETRSDTVGSDTVEDGNPDDLDSGENSSNPDEDAKFREEELLQVFGLILLIYGFAAGLILEGLARGNSIPQGKTGDVEMDVVKDQNRLKAKGNDGMWDITGLSADKKISQTRYM